MQKKIMFFIVLQFFISSFVWANVNFIQITDPHIFEENRRMREARNSLAYFYLAIEKINQINIKTKTERDESIEFVILTGDIGIEKLLKIEPANKDDKSAIPQIEKNGQTYNILKDQEKWDRAKEQIAHILQDSVVKLWLFVPGNNDLYEELPYTITFFQSFIQELQDMPEIKKSGISLVDFRLESTQKIDDQMVAGTFQIGNLLFVGWDNSFFKNNNSIKRFIKEGKTIVPYEETIEHQHVEKLHQILSQSTAQYAYIFYHIPEVDDPYMVKFEIDDEETDNTVTERMQEAAQLLPTLAKEIYPYSAWTLPSFIRKEWEDLVTNKNFKNPAIKGLFAGHFHGNNKEMYSHFTWLKTRTYKPDILKKLYVAPPISIKNQADHPIQDRARGGQIITIDPDGNIKREFFWLS